MLLVTAKSVALSAVRQGVTLDKNNVHEYVLYNFGTAGLVHEYMQGLSFEALGHWLETVLHTQALVLSIVGGQYV